MGSVQVPETSLALLSSSERPDLLPRTLGYSISGDLEVKPSLAHVLSRSLSSPNDQPEVPLDQADWKPGGSESGSRKTRRRYSIKGALAALS